MAICILLKDNSIGNCELLQDTIQEIINNLEELKTFDIESKDIYIFIFINEIIENNLVKKNQLKIITKAKNYLKTPVKLKELQENLKIDIICKKGYMADIESLQCVTIFCHRERRHGFPTITMGSLIMISLSKTHEHYLINKILGNRTLTSSS